MFNRKNKKMLAYLTVLLSFMFMSAAAFGQGAGGASLTGTVTDTADVVIPKVSVTIRNIDTGIENKSTTNNRGQYTLMNLRPGTYTITAIAEGYEPYTSNVRLSVGSRARLDIRKTETEAH